MSYRTFKSLPKMMNRFISGNRRFLSCGFAGVIIFNFTIFIFVPIIAKNIIAQEYRVIHPYRQLDIGTSISDGYAVKDDVMYLATLFDGHIYQFNLNTGKLSDRFQIHPQDKNQNSPGAMIYVRETNQLYAGTSKSFTSIPFIYLFDPDGDALPQKVLKIDSLGIYSFFSPVQIKSHLYWGCYHTQLGGVPKIIKMNIYDHSWEVKEFTASRPALQANYTFSLELLGDILYISTESGQILKYDTRSDQFLPNTINLSRYGARYIQHLETDGKGLWAMATVYDQPLFYIEKPRNKQPKILRVPTSMPVLFSRIFSSKTEPFLYGQGYRIRYLRKRKFDYHPLPYLNFANLRDIMGTFTLGGNQYLLGENNHIKNTDVTQREFRIAQLPPPAPPDIITFSDIRGENTGAILLTMSGDLVDKIYMSTYLIGFLYSMDSKLEGPPTILTDNRNVRLNEQADIFFPYPAIKGSMLLGCYKGSSGSAVLYFFNPHRPKGQQWMTKSLPEKDGKYYPRLTAMAVDERDLLYLGTGEMTVSATTQPAAVFSLTKQMLENQAEAPIQTEIPYRWPEDSDVTKPIRIMAMAQDGDHLYCISYHSVPQGIKNKFFRINLKTQEVQISKIHQGAFAGIRDKTIFKEGKYLIVAFDSRLYRYDLDNFSFESPVDVLELEKTESIKAAVGDGRHYYLGTERKILQVDRQFRITDTFLPITDSDIIQGIDLVDGALYAITKNGLLIRYHPTD